MKEISKVGQQSSREKKVFTYRIDDYLAEAYTFHNLKPATVYKVTLLMRFKDKH